MKEKMRSVIRAVFLSMFFLTACGKAAGTKNLQGSYRLSGMEKEGLGMDEGSETLAFLSSIGDTVTLELSEDGTGTLSMTASSGSTDNRPLRWDKKTVSEEGGTSYAWTLEGSELTLKAEDGRVLVFTKAQ